MIVDFTGLRAGTEIYLINEGPDEPFAGGLPFEDFEPADPHTTGQVMKFVVRRRIGRDKSLPAEELELPRITQLGQHVKTRKVALLEESSSTLEDVGPRAALLGAVDGNGFPTSAMWSDPITEDPKVHETEVWEIYNFTADAHPIHVHQVMFEVVNRQHLVLDDENMPVIPARTVGGPIGPESWETGLKDTVIAYPGQVTRIKAAFDIPGQFVWHCHIVEHEDHEMMRPFRVQ
jgi:FtsP/CotA-like multicopper oxidase with cupredoxin domain